MLVALVIYSFYCYMVEYIGGDKAVMKVIKANAQVIPHLFPFCFLKTWNLGFDYYYYTQGSSWLEWIDLIWLN